MSTDPSFLTSGTELEQCGHSVGLFHALSTWNSLQVGTTPVMLVPVPALCQTVNPGRDLEKMTS